MTTRSTRRLTSTLRNRELLRTLQGPLTPDQRLEPTASSASSPALVLFPVAQPRRRGERAACFVRPSMQ